MFRNIPLARVADTVMNRSLGGTSLAYIVADASGGDEAIKEPDVLGTIEGLQRRLDGLPVVGKTTSVVDFVKRINRALQDDDPKFSGLPDSKRAVGQYLFLFAMSAKPSDLTLGFQYYYQRMMDHGRYLSSLPASPPMARIATL